jgi:hypothetical protein
MKKHINQAKTIIKKNGECHETSICFDCVVFNICNLYVDTNHTDNYIKRVEYCKKYLNDFRIEKLKRIL